MTTVQGGLEFGGYGSYPYSQGLMLGSAEGKERGSERMYIASSHLLGPRMVWNGVVTTTNSATSTTFKIPRLVPYNEQLANYIVLVQPVGGSVAIPNTGSTVASGGTSFNFTTASYVPVVTPQAFAAPTTGASTIGVVPASGSNYYMLGDLGVSDTTDPIAYAPHDVSVQLLHQSIGSGTNQVVVSVLHV